MTRPFKPSRFVEKLPPHVGHNLRHHDTVRQHWTGDQCPCRPERVPHERKDQS